MTFNTFQFNTQQASSFQSPPSIYWPIWAELLPLPFTRPSSRNWVVSQEATVLHRYIGRLATMIDLLDESIQHEQDQFTVVSASDALDRYEAMLGLTVNPLDKSVEERRAIILSSLQSIGVTKGAIKYLVFQLTGENCSIFERYYDVRSELLPPEERFNWDIYVIDPSISAISYSKKTLEDALTRAKPEPTQYFIHYVEVLPGDNFIWDIHDWDSDKSWGN